MLLGCTENLRGARALEEINVVRKVPKPGNLRVGVVYPSLYQVAVDSLSFQMLYYHLNSYDDVCAERVFFSEMSIPPASTAETSTALKRLDALVFTVHYELDFVNILRILLGSGIEVFATKRERPLVIIGGPPVIANPVPLSAFADVIVVGEIEATVPELVGRLIAEKDSKRRFLDSLAPERGFFVPARGEADVKLNIATRLEPGFHPAAQVQPLRAPFKWKLRTAIEVVRGCIHGCSFCLEGRIFNILRERPVEDILRIAREGSAANMSKLVKLIGLSFFDHPQADVILEKLLEEGYQLSVPSLRGDVLNSRRLELLRRGGQKTLVIAPETGSLGLGVRIGKFVKLERAVELASEARKLGFTGIKLYFMVGIPGESADDLERTAEYVEKLSSASGFRGVRQLKITVSPFVPKPHTAWERYPFIGVEEAKRRINYLKKRLAGLADVRDYDPRLAWIQTIISRGDLEIGRVLLGWAVRGGGLGAWRAAIREAGVKPEKYTGFLEQTPWSFIKLFPIVRSPARA